MIAYVRMRIFSGRPNPEWTLNEADARKLAEQIRGLSVMTTELPKPKPRLGYRGMSITLFTGERSPQHLEVYNQWVINPRMEANYLDFKRDLERAIYRTAPVEVTAALGSMSFPQLITQGNEVPIKGLNPPDNAKIGCVNGPTTMNFKDWVLHASYNNCYNYANDVLNMNEWAPSAMPGTSATMPASAVTAKVRTALRARVLTDGLTRVAADKVPNACPAANKHYMAMMVRHHPGSALVKDFHCLRLDLDGTWSHKDASGLPRNTDDAGANPNTGDIITDLTAARFDGDPVLVGVYRATKDNANIK